MTAASPRMVHGVAYAELYVSHDSTAEIEQADGGCELLQAALMESDALLTVSSGYASEVASDNYMGCGLRDVIESKGIR